MSKREKVFNKTNGKCIYCGIELTINNYHMEHVIPRSINPIRNGKDYVDLLWPSCVDCNLYKGSLTIEEFRYKLEDVFNNNASTRMINKYYKVKKEKIKFWYEKNGIIIGGNNIE